MSDITKKGHFYQIIRTLKIPPSPTQNLFKRFKYFMRGGRVRKSEVTFCLDFGLQSLFIWRTLCTGVYFDLKVTKSNKLLGNFRHFHERCAQGDYCLTTSVPWGLVNPRGVLNIYDEVFFFAKLVNGFSRIRTEYGNLLQNDSRSFNIFMLIYKRWSQQKQGSRMKEYTLQKNIPYFSIKKGWLHRYLQLTFLNLIPQVLVWLA